MCDIKILYIFFMGLHCCGIYITYFGEGGRPGLCEKPDSLAIVVGNKCI